MGQNKPDVNCVVGAVTYNDGFTPARKTFKPTPQGASLFDYMKVEDKNQFGTLSGDREGAGPLKVAQARSQAARSQAAATGASQCVTTIDTAEKSFEIKNVSSFPVNFNLVSEVAGVDNISKERPFLLIPSAGTIPAQSQYTVKIIFQPDHESNNYFDVMLIDIPNQVNAKKMYIRGWAYSRQLFAREHDPFVWRQDSYLR